MRGEHEVQRRAELLDELVDREAQPGPALQLAQAGREAGPGVDQGHVQVEADDEGGAHGSSVGGPADGPAGSRRPGPCHAATSHRCAVRPAHPRRYRGADDLGRPPHPGRPAPRLVGRAADGAPGRPARPGQPRPARLRPAGVAGQHPGVGAALPRHPGPARARHPRRGRGAGRTLLGGRAARGRPRPGRGDRPCRRAPAPAGAAVGRGRRPARGQRGQRHPRAPR